MKRILVMLFVLLFPGIIYAAPFLTCDPNSDFTYFEITGLPFTVTGEITARADGSLWLDLAQTPIGTYKIYVKGCNNLWGVCSVEVPFDLKKPNMGTPIGIRIEAQ